MNYMQLPLHLSVVITGSVIALPLAVGAAMLVALNRDALGTLPPYQLSEEFLQLREKSYNSSSPDTSEGEAILIRDEQTPIQKHGAAEAFRYGYYQIARQKWEESLKIFSNDPETVIYRENARAISLGRASTVTIAVSVPIGEEPNVAQEILRGVAQAQQEINGWGGIDGKRLVVKIANDNNDPDLARAIAEQLVRDESVLGVVGHNSSNASIAAAPLYERARLVMISPTSVARELSGMGEYLFRTTPSSRIIADTLVGYILDVAQVRKITICYDSESKASTSFKEEFSLSYLDRGGDVVRRECDFTSNNFDPDAMIASAIAEESEALLVIPSVDNLEAAVKIIKANRNRLKLFSNHSSYTYDSLAEGGMSLKGMVLSVPVSPDSYSEFSTVARKLWGNSGSWRTASAYDATKSLLKAMEMEGFTREGIQRAMNDPFFQVSGSAGDVQFYLSGDRKGDAMLVRVESGSVSGTGVDFVPLR
jgi:branched-chain amino acid transport system substrate-binding protein